MDLCALFNAIDRRDAAGFASFIAEGGTFRMGSYPATTGPAEAETFVGGFFESLDHVNHVVERTYETDGQLFIEGKVTYGLLNGQEVTVPFLNRLRVDGAKAAEYLIYLDPTPVTRALA
jgi:hypothetical protein